MVYGNFLEEIKTSDRIWHPPCTHFTSVRWVPCTHFTLSDWYLVPTSPKKSDTGYPLHQKKSDWVPTSPKKIWLGTHFTLTLMKANFNANWSESSLLPFYNVITDVWHFTIRLNNFMTEILQSIGFLKKMFHQKQNILIIFV